MAQIDASTISGVPMDLIRFECVDPNCVDKSLSAGLASWEIYSLRRDWSTYVGVFWNFEKKILERED